MPSRFSRRSIVASIGAAATAGCIGTAPSADGVNDSENRSSEVDADRAPEECDLSSRTVQGRGEPAETTVEIERPDDVREKCALLASDVAFDRMDDRLELDLAPGKEWIFPSTSWSAGQYRPGIVVRSLKTNEVNGDGSYIYCPPPEYDFDEAVRAVPGHVTVTLRFETGGDEHECRHEIRVEQREMHQD